MKKIFPTIIFMLLLCSPMLAQGGVDANLYKEILAERSLNISFMSVLRGITGMAAVIFICWIFSANRKAICWGTVAKALLLQLVIAVSVLAFPAVQTLFEALGGLFISVLSWTKAGSSFLFGGLMDASKFGYVFIFQILPTIVFFSALMSLFFYLGIMQKIVWGMGWVLVSMQFTRRNYENIQSKAQVLVSMLQQNKIHPRLAFATSGAFTDPESAYQMSMEYYAEQEAKALEMMQSQTPESNESKEDEE